MIKDYFFPNPPEPLLEQQKEIVRAEFKTPLYRFFAMYMYLLLTPINNAWFKQHANTFVRRWLILSFLSFFLVIISPKVLWTVLPFTILGFFSTCMSIFLKFLTTIEKID